MTIGYREPLYCPDLDRSIEAAHHEEPKRAFPRQKAKGGIGMKATAKLAVALLCGIAIASPAVAADPAAASAAAQGQPGGKPDKIVCKREERGVGTLLSKSICMTRSQWSARAQTNRDNKDRIMDLYNRRATEPLLPGTPSSSGPN
jgi:hypothetical protein